MNDWYVVQTKPVCEERVARQLERLNSKGIFEALEVFCPKIKYMAAHRGGSDSIRLKPLFPSYLFLRWDICDPQKYHLVRYTRGVNKLLGDGERPVPISCKVIETIMARTNESGIIEQKTFKVGEPVKVRRGHLKDLIGVLERPVSDSGRVAVLLDIFNRQMRVHMKCADLMTM